MAKGFLIHTYTPSDRAPSGKANCALGVHLTPEGALQHIKGWLSTNGNQAKMEITVVNVEEHRTLTDAIKGVKANG